MMLNELPSFNGWTVDARLREFRRVNFDGSGGPRMERLPFASGPGYELVGALMRTADAAQWYAEDAAYFTHP
jgi:hypothetical protein